MEKEILKTEYTEGLKVGSENLDNPNWSDLYNQLIQDKSNQDLEKTEAFRAGLQDGYHLAGECHFEEWFKYDYSGSSSALGKS